MTRWTARTLALLTLLLCLVLPSRGGEKLPRTGAENPDLVSFDELMERFLTEHKVPGGALAVAKDGRLVYARGFGYADPDAKTPVRPRSKFRIASISKPITAAAILRLVEMGKLKLDDRAVDVLELELPANADPRLRRVTVLQLLQHTGGWDRGKSFDPMFRPVAIARELNVPPPAGPEHVIRYMLSRPLDFDPGSRYAYSNFGYCVLGRVIEKASGKGYEAFVRDEVLTPLKMTDTLLGRTIERAEGEVKYVDGKGRTATAVVGPDLGKPVPLPYGAWYLEAMDAHGGWISSAPDLVRFAAAFDRPGQGPLLKRESVESMFARPGGSLVQALLGLPPAYYGCGWGVRVVGEKGPINYWHMGRLDGTATLLARRSDHLCWAVLFNASVDPDGRYLGGLIDPVVHRAADRVKRWPENNLAPGE